MTLRAEVGPKTFPDGFVPDSLRLGHAGEMIVQQLHGRYYEQARRGNLFMAQAIVTAPVIYTTAAGTGGPLLWNPPTSGVNAVILAVSMGITVVSTVAAALGLTGNTGQTSAPTTTTAIDGRANLFLGRPASASTPYRIGTPANAGAFLLPFAALHTGALTVDNMPIGFVDVGGAFIIPPGAWGSIAASATATTAVGTFGMIYEEVPIAA
jgi:hypothetical protein